MVILIFAERVRGGPDAGAGHRVRDPRAGRRGAPHQERRVQGRGGQHLRALHQDVIHHGRCQFEDNQLSHRTQATF